LSVFFLPFSAEFFAKDAPLLQLGLLGGTELRACIALQAARRQECDTASAATTTSVQHLATYNEHSVSVFLLTSLDYSAVRSALYRPADFSCDFVNANNICSKANKICTRCMHFQDFFMPKMCCGLPALPQSPLANWGGTHTRARPSDSTFDR